MAYYSIQWKKSAQKELRKLPKQVISKIITSVENLSENPIPNGCRKIIGAIHKYRIRIGNYRVIYHLEDVDLVIEIIKIGHRKNIYK